MRPVAYYNEIDPFAAQWLRNLIAANLIMPGEVDERSIQSVDPLDLIGFSQCHFFAGIGVWSYALRLAGWPDNRPVWTGSCPCQPFSAAGKRKAFADERHLWPYWSGLIRVRRPVTIFGEQVASPDGYAWLDTVQADMEDAAYAFGACISPAAGYGAPHARHRIYFLAHTLRASGERHTGSLSRAQTALDSTRLEHGRFTDGLGDGCATGPLANYDSGGCKELRGVRLRRTDILDADGRGAVGGLGHANGAGPQGRRVDAREHTNQCAAGAPSPVSGFWFGAEWIPCADGKARPAQPRIFPLAHGTPARVGRLRAYGNAIVAPQAAEFIKAAMECMP